jgi:hypothetical protein
MKITCRFMDMSKPNRNGRFYANPKELEKDGLYVISNTDAINPLLGEIDLGGVIGIASSKMDGDDLVVDADIADSWGEILQNGKAEMCICSTGTCDETGKMEDVKINAISLCEKSYRNPEVTINSEV